MHVCMYESIYNAPLLQSKQSRVCAHRPNRKDVSLACYRIMSVEVLDRSDGGRELHSFGAQEAKLRGPKLEVWQSSTCKSPRAAECKWRRLVLAVTGTYSSCMEVLRSGLLATLEDDRTELENYPLSNWQPIS